MMTHNTIILKYTNGSFNRLKLKLSNNNFKINVKVTKITFQRIWALENFLF